LVQKIKIFNFGPEGAEVIIMKSNVLYALFISFIFCLQIVIYTNFREYEAGRSVQMAMINQLKDKNEKLKFEVSILKTQNGGHQRQPASIEGISGSKGYQEPIDLSEFYFSKIREYKKNNQTKKALGLLDKINTQSLNSEYRSQALYEKIQIGCRIKIDDICLVDMETLVTQYPDSTWTGKALQILSNYYEKNRRINESVALRNIIKNNFEKKENVNHRLTR
jgi:hypothetical protein